MEGKVAKETLVEGTLVERSVNKKNAVEGTVNETFGKFVNL